MTVTNDVVTCVERKLAYYQKNRESSTVKSELALLRHGIGKFPGAVPQVCGIIFKDLPESLQGKGDNPSYAEWALYAVLTLFSFHQQGKSSFMHAKGVTLGKAVRRLVPYGDLEVEARTLRRFNQMATSSDMDELTHHLRGMISLLRSHDIPLDYAALARDLFLYQTIEFQPKVRLKWGRDYYCYQQETKEDNYE